MTINSSATTVWQGNLVDGNGVVAFDSASVPALGVTWAARAHGASHEPTPEEFIAAAHSSCFSMAFAHALSEAGYAPEAISARATVGFVPGEGVTGSHLVVEARIGGIEAGEFARIAEEAKSGCPVSSALAGIAITIDARLV